MSNKGKKRPHQERHGREIRDVISEKLPKKIRGGSKSNYSTDRRVSEKELLDPVAEARKALERFEEVSGETSVNITPQKNKTEKVEVERDWNDHKNINNEGDFERILITKKRTNQKVPKLNSDLRDEVRMKDIVVNKEEEKEKARQKKRIEVGEARRREFRPKIAGLQDSNCLL